MHISRRLRLSIAATLMLALRSSLCGGGVLPAALTFLTLVPAPVEASASAVSHADAASFACLLSSLNTETSSDAKQQRGCQTGSCLHPVEVAAQSSFSVFDAPPTAVSAPILVSALLLNLHETDAAIIHPPPLFERARHHASSLVKRE